MLQPRILTVKPLPNYCLLIEYETGEQRIFDVKPYLIGDWFGALKDEAAFRTVKPCGTTVEWADGQDIAPHELYELSVSAGGGNIAG